MPPLMELYLSICSCVFLRKHRVKVPVSVKHPTQVCVNTITHALTHPRMEHKHRQPEAAHGAGIRFKLPNKAT